MKIHFTLFKVIFLISANWIKVEHTTPMGTPNCLDTFLINNVTSEHCLNISFWLRMWTFSVYQKVSNSFDTVKVTWDLTSCEKCSSTTIVSWLSSAVCMQSFDCLWNYQVIGIPISREILASDWLKGASEQNCI